MARRIWRPSSTAGKRSIRSSFSTASTSASPNTSNRCSARPTSPATRPKAAFDLERFTSFEGKTGPYLLYQAVRIKSLLRRAADAGASAGEIIVSEAAERDLALVLDAFEQAVGEAYDRAAPHFIAEHAYKLAQAYSKFYAACPVLAAPNEEAKASRLALSTTALRQLEVALDLLGIETPERM